MATKKLIAEMVLFKLAGGYPDGSFQVDERDLFDAIEDKVNARLKTDQFAMNLPSGGTIPENLMIATYENITVTRTSNERSKCTLPIVPIALPRNAGVLEIRPVLSVNSSAEKMLGSPIIPLQAGQSYLIKSDKLLNDLMGKWGYELNGKTVIFTKDLTTYDITKVDIKLIVFDMSQYGLTDELPIPADWIGQIEDELVKEYAPVQPESGLVNNFTNANQKAQ